VYRLATALLQHAEMRLKAGALSISAIDGGKALVGQLPPLKFSLDRGPEGSAPVDEPALHDATEFSRMMPLLGTLIANDCN
jgi:hypothetical protein